MLEISIIVLLYNKRRLKIDLERCSEALRTVQLYASDARELRNKRNVFTLRQTHREASAKTQGYRLLLADTARTLSAHY